MDWFHWVSLTELPGEAGVALQRRVVEGVPAVHHPDAGQRPDATQSQQVGVLQRRAPRSVQDASLQGAKAAVLRVAEHFDALVLCQTVCEGERHETRVKQMSLWDKKTIIMRQTTRPLIGSRLLFIVSY